MREQPNSTVRLRNLAKGLSTIQRIVDLLVTADGTPVPELIFKRGASPESVQYLIKVPASGRPWQVETTNAKGSFVKCVFRQGNPTVFSGSWNELAEVERYVAVLGFVEVAEAIKL